jgi:hypothetical protein
MIHDPGVVEPVLHHNAAPITRYGAIMSTSPALAIALRGDSSEKQRAALRLVDSCDALLTIQIAVNYYDTCYLGQWLFRLGGLLTLGTGHPHRRIHRRDHQSRNAALGAV